MLLQAVYVCMLSAPSEQTCRADTACIRSVVVIASLPVILEPKHFFGKLHWMQAFPTVHCRGAAVPSQSLYATREDERVGE